MIFLAGPHAAGKTLFANKLRQYNFAIIDLGPTLRQVHKTNSGSSSSFGEWIAAGEQQCGRHFTDEILAEEIKAFLNVAHKHALIDVVIVGSRSLSGIRYIEGKLHATSDGKKSVIIFLDAPTELLYERYQRREQQQMTLPAFKELLAEDEKLGINTIRREADYHIVNDGDELALQHKIQQFVATVLGDEGDTSENRMLYRTDQN